jgi:hypothetical protein
LANSFWGLELVPDSFCGLTLVLPGASGAFFGVEDAEEGEGAVVLDVEHPT